MLLDESTLCIFHRISNVNRKCLLAELRYQDETHRERALEHEVLPATMRKQSERYKKKYRNEAINVQVVNLDFALSLPKDPNRYLRASLHLRSVNPIVVANALGISPGEAMELDAELRKKVEAFPGLLSRGN